MTPSYALRATFRTAPQWRRTRPSGRKREAAPVYARIAAAALATARDALRPGGKLVFETRDPARRSWERWIRANTYFHGEVPGSGVIETWMDVTDSPWTKSATPRTVPATSSFSSPPAPAD